MVAGSSPVELGSTTTTGTAAKALRNIKLLQAEPDTLTRETSMSDAMLTVVVVVVVMVEVVVVVLPHHWAFGSVVHMSKVIG